MKRAACNKNKASLPITAHFYKQNNSHYDYMEDTEDNRSVVIDDNVSVENQLENQLTKALKEFSYNTYNISCFLQNNCSKTISHRVFVNRDLIDKSSNCKLEKSLTTRKNFSKSFNFNNNALIFNNNQFKENLSFYPKFSAILQEESKRNTDTSSLNINKNDSQSSQKRSLSTNVNLCINIIDIKDSSPSNLKHDYNVR